MAYPTQYSHFTFVPVYFVPVAPYSQTPNPSLAQHIAPSTINNYQSFVQPQSALTTTAVAERTLFTAHRMLSSFSTAEIRAQEQIAQGIEMIKQQKFEEGLAHFQTGFNFTPDSRFYTWLMTKWHTIIDDKIQENILLHVDTKLNRNPDDWHAKFVKALCCVKPKLYFLAIALLKDILLEKLEHPLTGIFLKTISQMHKRVNKQPQLKLDPEQIHSDMSFKRLLN